MAHASTPIGLDTRFDHFLQTPVGDDQKGTSVTVLSMLARLGVDPWREASDLAALPKGSAWERLDGLMARFTDVPSLIAERADVVTRLVASLPNGKLNANGSNASDSVSSKTSTRIYLILAVSFLLVHVIILMSGQ